MTKEINIVLERKEYNTIIRLEDDCNRESTGSLENNLFNELERPHEVIGIDLDKVYYMCSSAIAVFIRFRKLTYDKKIPLVFFNLKEPIKRALEIKGFEIIFTIMTETNFQNITLEDKKRLLEGLFPVM